MKELRLENCGLDDSLMDHLKVQSPVNQLSVYNNDVSRLCTLKHPKLLWKLDVSRTRVGDAALHTFFNQASGCAWLELDRCSVTDKTFDTVLKCKLPLKYVSVVLSGVSPKGILPLLKTQTLDFLVLERSDEDAATYEAFVIENQIKTNISMSRRAMTKSCG
jgi:hypothetical protein